MKRAFTRKACFKVSISGVFMGETVGKEKNDRLVVSAKMSGLQETGYAKGSFSSSCV